MEENIQLKMDLTRQTEESSLETKQLTYEIQRLLQQNNSLVQQLTRTELEFESFLEGSSPGSQTTKSPYLTLQVSQSPAITPYSRNDSMKALDAKLSIANDAVKKLEVRCKDLDKLNKDKDNIINVLKSSDQNGSVSPVQSI